MRSWLILVTLGAWVGFTGTVPLSVDPTPVIPPRVRVELYYESLCPYCRNFISTQLWPSYQKLKDVMDITLVPYGNALENGTTGNYSYTCQHGPNECLGNVIQSCAIEHVKDFDVYFPYIHCMEENNKEEPEKAARKCAANSSIPIDAIMTCANGSEGMELQHLAANRTKSLVPEQYYVPWVVLEGVHTEKLQRVVNTELFLLVCDVFHGPRPTVCPPRKIIG